MLTIQLPSDAKCVKVTWECYVPSHSWKGFIASIQPELISDICLILFFPMFENPKVPSEVSQTSKIKGFL